MAGIKFRRQAPVGEYIVDFLCYEKHLIIELDGSQHGRDKNIQADHKRQQWLEGQGFRVLRFLNRDVLQRTEEILQSIYRECERPHPALSRPRGRERELDHLKIEWILKAGSLSLRERDRVRVVWISG